jgi:uncharacterized Fe-S cluster-containing radical SAM superfamily enzyme
MPIETKVNPQKRKTLPSRFQLGDKVKLNFFAAGEVTRGEVVKIHFTDRKVLYDVEIVISTLDEADKPDEQMIDYLPDISTTRLYNIDSVFVIPE